VVLDRHNIPLVTSEVVSEYVYADAFVVVTEACDSSLKVFLLDLVLAKNCCQAASVAQIILNGELKFYLELILVEDAVEDVASPLILYARVQLNFALKLNCISMSQPGKRSHS
jgi:hypothetical protein